GRAIDVDVKDVEKDADALTLSRRGGDGDGFGYKAVGRGDNQAGSGRNGPPGVAKKPEEERSQKDGRDGPEPDASKPGDNRRDGQQRQTVDVTVTNHASYRLYGRSVHGGLGWDTLIVKGLDVQERPADKVAHGDPGSRRSVLTRP